MLRLPPTLKVHPVLHVSLIKPVESIILVAPPNPRLLLVLLMVTCC